MSAKKCVMVNCPFLGIASHGINRGQLVCLSESETNGNKKKEVLIEEITQAGVMWNKTHTEQIEACSDWNGKECSQRHFSNFIRQLQKKTYAKRNAANRTYGR